MYIVAETFSHKNYPRNCDPGLNYVMYFFDGNNKRIGSYSWIMDTGFAMKGKVG